MDDRLIFAAHGVFWAAFLITLAWSRRKSAAPEAPAPAASTSAPPATAPYSRALVGFHMTAFGVLYFGINYSVWPRQVYELFPFQRLAGIAVMTLGAFIACWALVYFRSWRFRAQLDAGHQLATGGPFAIVRHPIYTALNLFALGSALWVPNAMTAAGAVLMFIGSDLRGRAEEKLLSAQFPAEYPAFMSRTKRFLPFLY